MIYDGFRGAASTLFISALAYPATSKACSAPWPCCQRSTWGNVTSQVGHHQSGHCPAAESLLWYSAMLVLIQHAQNTVYYAPYWWAQWQHAQNTISYAPYWWEQWQHAQNTIYYAPYWWAQWPRQGARLSLWPLHSVDHHHSPKSTPCIDADDKDFHQHWPLKRKESGTLRARKQPKYWCVDFNRARPPLEKQNSKTCKPRNLMKKRFSQVLKCAVNCAQVMCYIGIWAKSPLTKTGTGK